MYPPIDMYIIESITKLYGWKNYETDVTADFHQTYAPNGDVYVNHPR